MKRALLLFTPAILAALIYTSCKKEDGSQNTVTPGSYRSLEEAINSTAPVAKSTALSVSSGGVLTAPGGTRFEFPPNAFETLTGGKVTGSVNITINDWLRKGDMVFGRVLPIAYYKNNPLDAAEPFEKVLQSGGEAFIQVTQNGQILRVKEGMHITVKFPQLAPSPALTGATGWVGRTMTGSANTVNWLSVDTNVLQITDIPDTIVVRADTFHYIQAAIPMGFNYPADYRSFTVLLNSPVTLEQSMAVAVYDGARAVYPLPSAVNGRINAVRIPSRAMHIAVMGVNKGNFYGGIVAVPAPANDSTDTVIIKAMEPPTLRLQLNSL